MALRNVDGGTEETHPATLPREGRMKAIHSHDEFDDGDGRFSETF